ncbi:leucyl aminopeptidase [Microbacterium caowuchunii]|uniref:Probable cytosol aminopeptidase n=1 Tax=Microbacterium caowuchunii TaxID=2614638 RepID=A0A5N0TNF0_9MICO|nr:leucyl aminopeptidase [Microbacterium caowuchunii]KAA9135717.1 leucyl aminopeptidase [Microbacterium caowuchunii]
MPHPGLLFSTAPLTDTTAEAILLALPPLTDPLFEGDQWSDIRPALEAVGFTGSPGTFQRVLLPGYGSLPVAVVGTGADPDAAAVRYAVGSGVRSLVGFDTVAVAAPGQDHQARAIAEGAGLGGYRFEGYKASGAKKRATTVVVHADGSDADLRAATVAADAAALVRDLGSIPAEWLGPEDFAQHARESVADLPVEIQVLDEHALREEGFGGILGVGQGSDRPPRLIRLDYAPETATRHVALVGKGITFDTGGLSLKPPASMVGMKYDMCGAATALAVLVAAARLDAPVRVTAWLCVAENMPSGRATRPGDVLRMRDGSTVEVLNTDAEGRLVLADGLVAASMEQPDLIVDVATLTGAITVALGNRHTGVMGDDAAVAEYLAAAERAGEPAWPLPLPAYMEDELDSPIADLVNAKIGDPAGGSLFAGLFLQRFVGRLGEEPDAPRIPWVHLDIAGSGMYKGSPFGYTEKGPTGATVLTLIELLTGKA